LNIVIFGATSRIAHECARNWAREGHALVLIGRDAARLEPVAADLRAMATQPDRILARILDFGDEASLRPQLLELDRELGGIDLVFIANGWLPDQAQVHGNSLALRKAVEVNALLVAQLAEAAAAVLEARRGGVLAVIGSVAGDRGRQSNYAYGTNRAFVERYCEGLRNRLHPAGVAVVLIKPGPTDTPMTRDMPVAPGARRPRLADPAAVAKDIVAGIARRAPVVYVPGIWRWIMLVIRSIPERLFVRLKL
jgi:decaprenylphospho-beta-D-erythro-pentofuranosid-2-ulose 2-reductase